MLFVPVDRPETLPDLRNRLPASAGWSRAINQVNFAGLDRLLIVLPVTRPTVPHEP